MNKVKASLAAPLYRAYEHRLTSVLTNRELPKHIGVILDGHRRFARAEGHTDYTPSYQSGMAKLQEFLEWCAPFKIPAVTAWVLSTDNLKRPKDELDPYFDVLVGLLDELPRIARRLDFSVQIIGSRDQLPDYLAAKAKETEELSPTGHWHFNLALGYGGREEIVDACRALVNELISEGADPRDVAEDIDVAGLSRHVYTADLPDPDLLIRTSGEARLSGFLLWQSAYAECAFVDPYWPAFRRVDFLRALRDFGSRDRRFGQ